MRATDLSVDHQRLIALAETFFIATDHPESGAAISHRGGNPGFVRVAGSRRLAIPDYAGNNLFNTLGNIAANPRVGLLFIGFESGRTLQLSGRATIDWDSARATTLAGAARVVDFELDEAIDNPHGFALRYDSMISHFNLSKEKRSAARAANKKAAGRWSRRLQSAAIRLRSYASKRKPPLRRTIRP